MWGTSNIDGGIYFDLSVHLELGIREQRTIYRVDKVWG